MITINTEQMSENYKIQSRHHDKKMKSHTRTEGN